MIGQNRPKILGKLAIQAGKNVFITGNSGHGKSTLAREICSLTNIPLLVPEPPTQALKFTLNKPSVTVICDEIHSSKSQDGWALFLDAFEGTVVFTTTNPEKVINAIKTRCQNIELAPYSEKELAEISALGGSDAVVISKICRGIPRKAKNLGDIFKVFDGNMQEFVLAVLEMSPYRNNLLYPEERLYLNTLRNSQPMSEKSLKTALNFGNFEELDLGLQRLGFIEISSRGRMLNE